MIKVVGQTASTSTAVPLPLIIVVNCTENKTIGQTSCPQALSNCTWHQYLVACLLMLLIAFTVIGNVLVILSVIIYQRMRTFTNKLLTSLATADLLVGFFVMPISLIDLLHDHAWPFDPLLCSVWATSDVLFCTASILNLCVISLDRYMAITSPLKYSRTRNRKTAVLLLGSVWLLSFVVCLPSWTLHGNQISASAIDAFGEDNTGSQCLKTFSCSYSPVISYRIYSALGSFFIPSMLMFLLYYKIFRVASKREQTIRNNQHLFYARRLTYRTKQNGSSTINSVEDIEHDGKFRKLPSNHSSPKNRDDIEKDGISTQSANTSQEEPVTNVLKAGLSLFKVPADVNRAKTAVDHFQMYTQGRTNRSTREKLVFLKERKALKTIAIVFIAFTVCWLPFFLVYLVEVFVQKDALFETASEVFLWLGYSNSVLNPIIYTMYNSDFRRCFRDLLTLGCMRQRRSMSIRKLHQQKSNC